MFSICSATTCQSYFWALNFPLLASVSRFSLSFNSEIKVFAKSFESSLMNNAPASPFSKTALNAGISLATTAVPADNASVRIIPNDSPPVFGAT